MSTTSLRRTLVALLAGGALMVAAFAGASPANASTLFACVKKSGSAHLFTKKPKCKKGESKLSWNSQGAAGKNGSNGTNGTNGKEGAGGKEGAPGQPQKGAKFAQTIASAGSSVSLFTLGEVSVKMTCGNFIANVVTLEASAPAGSLAEWGMAVTNSENTAPEVAQTTVREVTVGTGFGSFLTLTSNLKAPLTNKGHLNGSIITPSGFVDFDAYLEAGAEPKACVAKGAAFSIPA